MTPSDATTPSMSATEWATWVDLPTSVWISTYARPTSTSFRSQSGPTEPRR